MERAEQLLPKIRLHPPTFRKIRPGRTVRQRAVATLS